MLVAGLGTEQFEQVIGSKGLGQEIAVSAEGCHFGKDGRGGVGSGDQDDFAAGRDLTNAQRGFDSIKAAQIDIGDERIRMAGAGCFDGGFTAEGTDGSEAILLQNEGKSSGDDGFVIDDEDCGALGLAGRRGHGVLVLLHLKSDLMG